MTVLPMRPWFPSSFDVVIDPPSLKRSAAGSVAGTLYVRVGGRDFPESSWSDLVVIVLGGWLASALELLDGGYEPVQLDFLDGPFLIELRHKTPELLAAALITDEDRPVRIETVVHTQEVVDVLLGAARAILAECDARQWSTPDTVLLSTLINQLEQSWQETH